MMTYNADLSRKGPGLLVRDLERFDDNVLRATLQKISDLRPDVLALQNVDYDHNHVALRLIQERLEEFGHNMPYRFALAPNSGVDTGFDVDRDGKIDTARDRQGYGLFAGQGGIALLSAHPILSEDAVNYSDLLWRDLPDAALPSGYFSEAELSVFWLHSVAAWRVPIKTPDGVLQVLTTQTAPPVFDGPENRNGLRNADQIKFLRSQLPDAGAFVVIGGLNNDPYDGEGLKSELHLLLADPRLQDPKPKAASHFVNDPTHRGPPEQDTVDWARNIGSLRVDYVLPSSSLGVAAAAVERQQPTGEVADLPAHKPVWVDIFWK